MMYEGSVDQVTTTKATGWLYDRAGGSVSDVVAVLHGRVIGEAPVCLHRPDLEEVGFGDGLCGFDLLFYEQLRDADLPFVTVRPRGSNLAIPRTVDDTYVDLVGGLTAKHPSAGRNRSVLGGFWTDRTDALQILAGRVQTGSCPVNLIEPLRRLIADGFVTLPAGAGDFRSAEMLAALTQPGTAQPGALDAAAAELAGALVTEDFVALLRVIFDDVPVAHSFAQLTEPSERMGQASAFESFTSPAEVLAVYLPLGGTNGARLDCVRDSHEFPEFGRAGRSRWTSEGVGALPVIMAGREQPIDSVDFQPRLIVVMGPGTIHRVVTNAASPFLCIIFSPRRNTLVRHATGNATWRELALSESVRIRLS